MLCGCDKRSIDGSRNNTIFRFPCLLSFLKIPAAKALEAGLVDHVVDASTPDLVGAAVEFARKRLPMVAGGLGALRSGGRLLKVWGYMCVWYA